MKKLTTALLAAAALTTAVSAEGASNTGFYLGANAGVANTNVKYSYLAGGNSIATQPIQNFKNESGKMGGLFGIFAGYGMVVGSGAYVGGELYGGFDTTKVTTFDDSATGGASTAANNNGFWKSTVKRTNYYGIAARVGYMVTPNTLAYIRLGVEAGNWKADVTPNQGAVDAQVAVAANKADMGSKKSGSKRSVSLAPGLGLETYLSKNMFLRAEYSYLFGPKITINQDVSGFNQTFLNGSNVKHEFKITQHAFKVGVGYKF